MYLLTKNRYPWIVLGMMLAMAVLIQCGSENNNETPVCSYPIQNFTGGSTSLAVNNVVDGCLQGGIIVVLEAKDPGYRGPYTVTLPGYAALQTGSAHMTINNLPFVGTVDVALSISGNSISLSVPEDQYSALGCQVTAGVSGQLTPCSTNTAEGRIDLNVISTQGQGCPVNLSNCTVSFVLSGS